MNWSSTFHWFVKKESGFPQTIDAFIKYKGLNKLMISMTVFKIFARYNWVQTFHFSSEFRLWAHNRWQARQYFNQLINTFLTNLFLWFSSIKQLDLPKPTLTTVLEYSCLQGFAKMLIFNFSVMSIKNKKSWNNLLKMYVKHSLNILCTYWLCWKLPTLCEICYLVLMPSFSCISIMYMGGSANFT